MQYFHLNKISSKSPDIYPSKHTEFKPSYKSMRQSPLKKNNGFSLVELMVTIAIAAIAVTIALPSLSSFTVQMRVDNEVSELQRLLLTTRNAAINSGQNATLCPLQANNTCQNVIDWTGRIGVVSIDGLIKEREAIQGGDRLDFNFATVTYNPSGQLINNNIGVFSYCPNGFAEFSRGVILALSGRAYLSSDINNDGLDQDRNSNNIVCP